MQWTLYITNNTKDKKRLIKVRKFKFIIFLFKLIKNTKILIETFKTSNLAIIIKN
jgi:hypothetical protein